MARPKLGAIFSAERRVLAKFHGRILFANSDLSDSQFSSKPNIGASRAAERVLSQIIDKPVIAYASLSRPQLKLIQ